MTKIVVEEKKAEEAPAFSLWETLWTLLGSSVLLAGRQPGYEFLLSDLALYDKILCVTRYFGKYLSFLSFNFPHLFNRNNNNTAI